MSSRLLGERLTARWVRLYSRGVTADVRAERIGELASDVWEHQHHNAARGTKRHLTSLQITSRLVCGMPADLAWRRRQAHTTRNATTGVSMFAHRLWAFTRLLIVVQVVVLLTLGVVIALGRMDDPADPQHGAGRQLIVMGVVTLVGLVIRHRRGAVGVAMICLASLFAAGLYWFSFILLTSLATVILTLITAPWDPTMRNSRDVDTSREGHRGAAELSPAEPS